MVEKQLDQLAPQHVYRVSRSEKVSSELIAE